MTEEIKPLEPPAAAPPGERLSIAQLLLWTAMSAVLLGVDRRMDIWNRKDLGFLAETLAFAYAPLFGATAAAVMLAIWRTVNGGVKFPAQPGHWLLVLSGVTAGVILSIRVLLLGMQAGVPGLSGYLAIRALGNIAAILINRQAIRSTEGAWRAAFGIALVGNVISLVVIGLAVLAHEFAYFIAYLETFIYCAVTGAVLLAVIRDLGSGTRRDFVHWAGVVVRIIYAGLTVATPFLIRWVRDRGQ